MLLFSLLSLIVGVISMFDGFVQCFNVGICCGIVGARLSSRSITERGKVKIKLYHKN